MSYISAITDPKNRDQVIVWERDKNGDRIEKLYPAQYYFYIDDDEGEYETIYGTHVTKVVCRDSSHFYNARKTCEEDRIQMWESDIGADIRVLSEHYYEKPAPKLHITHLDIEVDFDPAIGFSSPQNPYAPINAISLFHEHQNRMVVICVPPPGNIVWTNELLEAECNKCLPLPTEYRTDFIVCEDETELLLTLVSEIKDSDVLDGWNSELFDFPYIAKRIEKTIGKHILRQLSFLGAEMPQFKEIEVMNNVQLKLEVSGRLLADYMNLVKKYEPGERPSYKLSSVSDDVLVNEAGEPLLPKLEYEGNLADLYRNDFAFFIRYNFRDCEILRGFEQKLGYIDLANQMYHISCGQFQHVNGTLKLAELAIVNHCHHTLNKVVNNTRSPEGDAKIDGAHVLFPQIGMHKWVGSIDINSLYPNSIQSLNISPETIRGQFETKIKASEAIAGKSIELLNLTLDSGDTMTMSGDEWYEWLSNRKWAVSGYGTVFDQNYQGIIPSIIANWIIMRKKHQTLKKEAETSGIFERAEYHDRLQYVMKIKLNSLYGALNNKFFRFYDLRMGSSITAIGRTVLMHQCRKVAELLDGDYNVEFPMYETVKDTEEAGHPPEVALHGPVFKGEFMSESIISGDTDSTYFKTHATCKEDAILIANTVADKVNKSFPKFMRETFLCNSGFDTFIKCGREIVSDNGIFVQKKRYILHVVDIEGKSVDKIKLMGLDTKKSTLPKAVADILNNFIERLLKGEAWEDISTAIVKYKDELINSPNIMSIGLPKGVNKVEYYTKNFEENPATNLPGHIAAGIAWNMCLDEHNDKTSPRITSGMKIKVFYIIGTYHRFKSIAIPTDVEVVPQWFLDNFTVDKDAHIERLVDNPLSNILIAIGKKCPTKSSMLFDSIFEF